MNNIWICIEYRKDGVEKKFVLCDQNGFPLVWGSQDSALKFYKLHKDLFDFSGIDRRHTTATAQAVKKGFIDDVIDQKIKRGELQCIFPLSGVLMSSNPWDYEACILNMKEI